LDEIHCELLLKFKEKKDSAVERYKEMKNQKHGKVERLEEMQQQYNELADKQYKLEFKNGVAMINGITSKKLSEEVNFALKK
jgi:hypothetical protein